MSSPAKLTDTQRAILFEASKRKDRCLIPPKTLKAAAAQKVATKLVKAGLVRESICKVPEGEFDFLGYTFGRMFSARTGQARIGYRPSKKSIQRVVEKVHALTGRSGTWQETTTLVSKVNRTLRGWANYFRVGTVSKAYRALDAYAAMRFASGSRTRPHAFVHGTSCPSRLRRTSPKCP